MGYHDKTWRNIDQTITIIGDMSLTIDATLTNSIPLALVAARLGLLTGMGRSNTRRIIDATRTQQLAEIDADLNPLGDQRIRYIRLTETGQKAYRDKHQRGTKHDPTIHTRYANG